VGGGGRWTLVPAAAKEACGEVAPIVAGSSCCLLTRKRTQVCACGPDASREVSGLIFLLSPLSVFIHPSIMHIHGMAPAPMARRPAAKSVADCGREARGVRACCFPLDVASAAAAAGGRPGYAGSWRAALRQGSASGGTVWWPSGRAARPGRGRWPSGARGAAQARQLWEAEDHDPGYGRWRREAGPRR